MKVKDYSSRMLYHNNISILEKGGYLKIIRLLREMDIDAPINVRFYEDGEKVFVQLFGGDTFIAAKGFSLDDPMMDINIQNWVEKKKREVKQAIACLKDIVRQKNKIFIKEVKNDYTEN